MTLQSHLTSLFSEAFTNSGSEAHFGVVTQSDRPELGQFQCNGALAAAKSVGKNPRELAEMIINTLDTHEEFASLEIAGPGFINIVVSDEVVKQYLQKLQYSDPLISQKIVIDFGGPNVAKPLHIGHLRSTVIGDSLLRIYRFLGAEVVGENHLGDWGTPMGMVIGWIAKLHPTLPYFDSAFSGPYPEESPVSAAELEVIYPEAAKAFKIDPLEKERALDYTRQLQLGVPGITALWDRFVSVSITALKQDFDQMGITFDYWKGESHYHNRIAPLIERLEKSGEAIPSEGAIVIPLEDLPPLLLKKSDGAYLYGTTDLATLEERILDDQTQTILYVVDQRQSLHFKQVFMAARQIGIASSEVNLQHVGFGTVNGLDGKPFKTREGGVMKLADLMSLLIQKATERMQEVGTTESYSKAEQSEIAHSVGMAALKFADLINHRASDYIFDIDRFVSFEGKTGPYLIYTAVRIKSILSKMNRQAVSTDHLVNPAEAERNLALTLTKLPDVIQEVTKENTPHILAEHLFILAQEFNRFYQTCNISRQEDVLLQNSWLALSSITLEQLTLGLELLGISVPERM